MDLVSEYRDARSQEAFARLRRLLVLRAWAATVGSQRVIAKELGVSDQTVSQQLKISREVLANVDPQTLLEAAAPLFAEIGARTG